MINNILLISEEKIKSETGLNDNVYGKSLLPAIREAQQIGLCPIIGEALYDSLCTMVDNGSITADTNSNYKYLLDNYIAYYLLYKVISDLIPIVGVKIANIGVVISNDEHIANLSEDERNRVDTYYLYRSDFYAKRLQEYLKANIDLFPELKDNCNCDGKIKPNLESAASLSLWVGGLRGYRIIRKK